MEFNQFTWNNSKEYLQFNIVVHFNCRLIYMVFIEIWPKSSTIFCNARSNKISQNSQENTCVGISYKIVAGHRPFNKVAGHSSSLLKERLRHRCFHSNFVKFLRTPFLENVSGGCFCNVFAKSIQNTIPYTTKINQIREA